MIKRILVALDPDEDTPVATRYAIWLAQQFDSSLTGLAVVDTSNIYFNVGGGEMDSLHYARGIWEELSEETREVSWKLLSNFKSTVEQAGIRHTAIEREGASFDRIIEGMKYHDLLIVGRNSHFFYNEPKTETKTLAKIVKDGVAPTLVVTERYRELKKVLVAFDGSSPAARSLKSFVQLMPHDQNLRIELLNVATDQNDDEQKKSAAVLALAEIYLNEHGFAHITKKTVRGGKASDRILERQQETDPDLIVMGAHSVSAIRRVTFGSNTHDMITKTGVPLFLSP